MDQFISANGAEDHALLLDCSDLSFKLVPIPANVALVIANTMVKHASPAANTPRAARKWKRPLRSFGKHRPGVKFLRDATLNDLGKWGQEMSPNALKRARHVVSENTRTVQAAKALLNGDFKTLGALMAGAHWSYSHDFEASCAEADAMVALAQICPDSSARASPAEASAAAPSTLWN